ncbi:uncharacterized protein FA14DRAFT_160430 [Meira miltonrushii]|uniref:Transcription elongation factor Eaf N-terminal domain-containing protein n=1 Tax=Meira miltonrushii TaxID=1280837 RepID=A0A316VGN8_9BASI|nr:uncharacterized protein FA14DRAFT_160430 [Meira miltonrushii]PWN35161.1 hypothetical protein FA14DRAFT_160430 [Meira miltonrushii]
MSASASTSAIPILLGSSLKAKRESSTSSSRQPLVSVKYNFKPPSISKESDAFLHCPKCTQPEWLLEYAGGSTSKNGIEQSNDAQSFTGTQSAAKDVDCVLVWDDRRQAYVLDRITSSFSLKFDRKHTKLSKEAKDAFSAESNQRRRSSGRTSALGLDIPEQELETQLDTFYVDDEEEEGEDSEMHITEKKPNKDAVEEGESDDDFARQLQLDLEEMDTDQRESTDQDNGRDSSPKGIKTGLGLVGAHGHLMNSEEVITPRGSPYLDRSSKLQNSNTHNAPGSVPTSANIPTTTQMRSTPGMSPLSVANSPRPTGLESSLSATWRPPAQRSAVAMAYDEDEDDEDDDDDESEDEEDDEEEEGAVAAPAGGEADDDDLDEFARQLDSSMMEPPTPIEDEKPAPTKGRRSSTRTKR